VYDPSKSHLPRAGAAGNSVQEFVMNGFLNLGSWWLNLGHVISVEFQRQEHGDLQGLVTLTGHTSKHLNGRDAQRLQKFLQEHENAGIVAPASPCTDPLERPEIDRHAPAAPTEKHRAKK
jgi:hypothetical protein